jgi:hypothetical protein
VKQEKLTPLLLIRKELQKDKTHQSSREHQICRIHLLSKSSSEKQNICRGRDEEKQNALCEGDEENVEYEEGWRRNVLAKNFPITKIRKIQRIK